MPEKVKDKIMRLEKDIANAHEEHKILRGKLNNLSVKFVELAINSGAASDSEEALQLLEEDTIKNPAGKSNQLMFNFRRSSRT